MIRNIIFELNKENGSNYKINVLKSHQDNELLKCVLKMAYDRVEYTYGVTLRTIDLQTGIKICDMTLEEALDDLEKNICSRKFTGHNALQHVADLIASLSEPDGDVFRRIINRDLKINLGKTQINKVFKGLITKPVYMRCDTYKEKTSKNISYPAYVQLKADGTYREFSVHDGEVQCQSRSGEKYEYPVIFEQMSMLPDGFYHGELTVKGISDRAEGNGLINSDNPPHDDIVVELWDYITPEEYQQAGLKDKKNPCKTPYSTRFSTLIEQLLIYKDGDFKNVKLIPYKIVESLPEALKQTSEWMSQGFEGSILKDANGVFKDGTSKHQLKLKLEISVEMRCVGFHEGTKGTKREGKVGSIMFANDEGTIKGRCSGFTDKELDYFTENQDELLGKIMEVQFNDLTKARNNDFYALSHPRFIEWRNDKDETDTLEKAFALREMALNLGS